MICPRCKEDDTQNREMCPNCGAPIRPIPVPPLGKIKFGKYEWQLWIVSLGMSSIMVQ